MKPRRFVFVRNRSLPFSDLKRTHKCVDFGTNCFGLFSGMIMCRPALFFSLARSLAHSSMNELLIVRLRVSSEVGQVRFFLRLDLNDTFDEIFVVHGRTVAS